MAQGLFARLFGRGSKREDALARYLIAEVRSGRDIDSVLEDPYIKNRAEHVDVMRLLDRTDVVEALGTDAVSELRQNLADLRPTP